VRKRSENMKTFTEKYWIRLRAIGLILICHKIISERSHVITR